MVSTHLIDDPAERFAVFPVTTGHVESSGRTETSQPRRRRGARMQNPFDFLTPKISTAIQKLIRALKSFSKLFDRSAAAKEKEMEMEIGFPTDVKHLTHIGWDGMTLTNLIKGLENLKGPPELIASATISLKQFELAMAAQGADQQHQQQQTGTVNGDRMTKVQYVNVFHM